MEKEEDVLQHIFHRAMPSGERAEKLVIAFNTLEAVGARLSPFQKKVIRTAMEVCDSHYWLNTELPHEKPEQKNDKAWRPGVHP